MKHTLFLTFLLSLFFTACKKDDSEPQITGIADMEVRGSFSNKMQLTVSGVDGKPKKTNLSVSNLPEGVTATFDPENAFPDYVSTLTISAGFNAKEGVYPIKLTARTTSGKNKDYYFNLTIIEACDIFSGKYTATYYLNTTGAPELASNTVEMKKDPGNNEKLIISNLLYDGTLLTATRNCSMQSLDIDYLQQITSGPLAGYQTEYFSGGTFIPPTMEVTVKKGTQTYSYNVILSRQ